MALDQTSCLIIDDDLLNFSLDDDNNQTKPPYSSLDFSNPNSEDPDDYSCSFPEFAEEELEWLSNKDAFPGVETCFDILSYPTVMVVDHQSPVSVLENSSSRSSHSNGTITSCCGSLQVPMSYPVRKRSNRRRRLGRFPELQNQQCWWWNQVSIRRQEPQSPSSLPKPPATATGLGRRCQHCLAETTPQWRAGPMGPKTLCNACGVRYKSGRLVPEYRPASSPTFSSALHSNSHRKIMEMRKKMQHGYGVG